MQFRADLSFTFDTEHDPEITKAVDNLLELLHSEGTLISERLTSVRGGKGDVVQRDTERFKHFAPDPRPVIDPEVFMAVQEAEKQARDYLYNEMKINAVQGMTHVPHDV